MSENEAVQIQSSLEMISTLMNKPQKVRHPQHTHEVVYLFCAVAREKGLSVYMYMRGQGFYGMAGIRIRI